MKILIVGNREGTSVGGCFERASQKLQLDVQLIESRLAMEAPAWIRRVNWWLRGRRPTLLTGFSQNLLQVCKQERPHAVIVTGIAPPNFETLRAIGDLGIQRINYLTDDPWNKNLKAPWFMKALPCYDNVFSPRQSNLEDLARVGCRNVSYLPFAYAPELQFLPQPTAENEHDNFSSCDVIFVGSGDKERISYIVALMKNGFKMSLYGDFWDRFPETRGMSQGSLDPPMLCQAIGAAKVALCLVRRSNRDGHSMRSFEIPAIGTCMLTEDTPEHRAIFGADGQTVVYFWTIREMEEKLRWLLTHDEERIRLAQTAHRRITEGKNTYQDRLVTMLKAVLG